MTVFNFAGAYFQTWIAHIENPIGQFRNIQIVELLHI